MGRRLVGALLVVLLAASGCAVAGATGRTGEEPLRVFATTGYLADAVATIAPEAEVTTMVGPGGDPHTYQPSTRDIVTLHEADLVVWNGLHLEAQMVEVLASLEDRQLAVGEQLPTEDLLAWPDTDADGNPLHDPHIWNSPEAWAQVVDQIGAALARVDPAHADAHTTSAAAHRRQVEQAGVEAAALMARIPAERRVLVSGHDAFGYLGAVHGLEVHATDFISSEAVLSPRQLSDLADLVVDRRVPVIFQDNQKNPQAVTSLGEAVHSRGWEVRVSDQPLYADSLGSEPGVDTWLGAYRHNTRVIAAALGAA